MIRTLLLAAALLLAPVAAAAQTLTVTNGEGRVTTFTPETLAELPRGTAKLAGKTAYEGIDLTAVLREAAVPLGARLHASLRREGTSVLAIDRRRPTLASFADVAECSSANLTDAELAPLDAVVYLGGCSGRTRRSASR